MSLDKNELKYLISELKKYFVMKSDIGDLGGSGVTEDVLNDLKGEIEEFVENKNYVTHDHMNEQIQDIEQMLGGKAIRYITQAEFNELSEEEKANPEISWVITDKPEIDASMLHNHDNMDILGSITQEQIDSMATDEELLEVKSMLGGKAIRYITQAEFNELSEEEKANPEISWVITDFEDKSHEHNNMDILDSITQEQIDAWNSECSCGDIFDKVLTDEDLQPIINEVELLKSAVEKPPTYVMPTLSMNVFPSDIPLNTETEIKISFKFNKNDAGNINNVILKRNGVTISEGEILSEFNDVVNATDANSISYTLTVMYDEGGIKNSNLGNPYPDTNIKAGEITVEKFVSVFAPSYYGAVKSFDVSLLNVINNTSRNCTFTSIFLDDEKFVYMYPSSFGEIQSIKDANNFEYIDSYTKERIKYNGIDYLVYILTDAVTISDFKQVFS